MKKTKDYTLLALAIPVIIVALFHFGLSCEIKKDKKAAPVNNCHFERGECPGQACPNNPANF